MTGSELTAAPGRSTPPQEIKFAIYLQAIFFLLGFRTDVVALALRNADVNLAGTAIIVLLFMGIWLLWLCGLWWRLNWVRWLTIISDVGGVCFAVRSGVLNHQSLDTLSYVAIAVAVTTTVMFLRPIAGHWYRHKAG